MEIDQASMPANYHRMFCSIDTVNEDSTYIVSQ